MSKNKLQIGSLAAAFTLFFSVSFACNAETPVRNKPHRVAGEKLDSGLGKLPHYSQWAKNPETRKLVALANRIPGEKLDSGLGELPPYREWAKYPHTNGLVALASRVPGEKLDSGLGELPPYFGRTDKISGWRYSMEVASGR